MEARARTYGSSGASPGNLGDRYDNYANYSSYLNDEPMPDAASEKEQGNEYFKQKKFAQAIECYSRSIGLSPSAVAFANRAMAYLKLRRQSYIFYVIFTRFEEAENDCTEALNLDDRYVKAYSRRITARKELGKLKEAMDGILFLATSLSFFSLIVVLMNTDKQVHTDAEFAVSIDPNNPELRKQYSEIKELHMKEVANRSKPTKHTVFKFDKSGDKKDTSHAPSSSQKDSFMEVDPPSRVAVEIREKADGTSKGGSGVIFKDSTIQPSRDAKQKPGPEASIQDLASRAASRYMASTVKSVKTPKTAYDFEVSWRALSDDTAKQTQLLKSIPPSSLPEIFKNALSAAFLIDIVRCTTSIFRCIPREDTMLAVSILENLAKVPRFDLIIMCLSSMHKSELRKVWDQIFLAETASADQVEALRQLRAKYIQEGLQDNMFTSN
uniref:RNA-polymerase II-associated protein 3-like C-terminal domain-containing protein n=1 Tax=Oryza meridionalis TaxID=40149 RepID=A0A0E0DLJ4_9ORYZ